VSTVSFPLTVHSLNEKLRGAGNEPGLAHSAHQPMRQVQASNRQHPDMFIYSSLDRDALQKLLANAFAVQQSQMDKQWLSAIVEVQGLIGKRELDVDGTMQLIVDRAQKVANATGVAIALFKGHQLVYRAGSGSAADYVGRQVMATLSVPADTTGGREILRVEDAETDTRIQAEICRQFGAKSLLILLIYHEQSVAGVLEVFFRDAHAFQDSEVRAYRLMAGLIGEAMSQAIHHEREKIRTAPRPAIPNPAVSSLILPNPAVPNPAVPNIVQQNIVQQRPPQRAAVLNHPGSTPDADRRAIQRPFEATKAVDGKWSILRQPAVLAAVLLQQAKRAPAVLAATLLQQAKRAPWEGRRWNVAAAAVAALLVLTSWFVYNNRRPAPSSGPSAVQAPIGVEPQSPVLRLKQVSSNGTPTLQPAPVLVKPAGTGKASLRRVRVGENEVDYIGDDVTIRYFTPKPKPTTRRVRGGASEVAYIGDDVTVRYFKPKAAAVPPTQSIGAAPMQKQ
jgi:GAF domain